jgi:hypothetical protein
MVPQINDGALGGHLPGQTNGEFYMIFGLVMIMAAITQRE